MKLSSSSSFTLVLTLLSAAPLFADVTVTNPLANSTVGTPFVLSATASPCSGQPITSMGYSLDSGSTTTFKGVTSLNLQVSATAGSHTLHVKSWGKGTSCGTKFAITVTTSVAPPLYTDVVVSQPTGAFKLVSPFAVVASGTQCQSQPIAAFGFAIDDGISTTVVAGSSLNAQVSSPTGSHTLHVKSWGNAGSSCAHDVAINVVPSPVSTVPSSAIAVNSIQTLTNWRATFDTGTTGSGYGTTSLVNTPNLSGTSRKFVTTSTSYGGIRYAVDFGADTSATNFLYDAWVYLGSGSANIANLELDSNQVTANGQTVIYAFQCDSWSKTWAYSANLGTALLPQVSWVPSTSACNVQKWAPNTWHHVQVTYSRDAIGNVTYQSVWLDNVEQDINATVFSSFALGWSPALVTNFQVDGFTSATSTSTAYLDNLTIYRW